MKAPICPKCDSPMCRNGYTPGGAQRWICGANGQPYCYQTTDPGAHGVRTQSGRVLKAKVRRKLPPIYKRNFGGVTTILVTAAQNATPAHTGFVKNAEALCNHRSAADLFVIPLRYKNPTSRWHRSQANEEVWDDAFTPYLCNQRKRINKNLIVLGDVKTQPTATNPLSGFDAITHAESGILGHTKLQLRTVATPQQGMPKILTTTGAATVKNYTDTKTGKLGDFHHTVGACLIEIKGKKFHIRQINARKSTGEFIDLRDHFAGGKRVPAPRYKGLALGDWHKDFTLKAVEHATFGPGGMVETLEPEVIAWHDLNDNYAVNPHHNGNAFNTIAKIRAGRMDARAELDRACDYVIEHTPKNTISVIVPSNHNEFLTRAIIGTDWRTQPGNAEFMLETALAMVRGTKLTERGTEYPDAFVYWARKRFEGHKNIVVLDRGDSYMVGGIELGLHFDKGPNGARGSLRNLRRIGVKVMGGHGHGPGIDEGGTQVGTGTGALEYTIGSPSGWMNTHGSINALDKRSLHNIIGREWRLQ